MLGVLDVSLEMRFRFMTLLVLGRFYGKLQSRSFPELSDAVKEKPPVRQLSENQSSSSRHGQTKLPVASTKYSSRHV